ncbi:MAG: hypothetical protein WCL32_17875 [Planctomycetota bacterium]
MSMFTAPLTTIDSTSWIVTRAASDFNVDVRRNCLSSANAGASSAIGNRLKPRDGPVARTERIHVGSEAPEELHVKVAERRVSLRVEGEVLSVAETAAGDDDRHVLIVVAAGVAMGDSRSAHA